MRLVGPAGSRHHRGIDPAPRRATGTEGCKARSFAFSCLAGVGAITVAPLHPPPSWNLAPLQQAPRQVSCIEAHGVSHVRDGEGALPPSCDHRAPEGACFGPRGLGFDHAGTGRGCRRLRALDASGSVSCVGRKTRAVILAFSIPLDLITLWTRPVRGGRPPPTASAQLRRGHVSLVPALELVTVEDNTTRVVDNFSRPTQ